MSKNKIRFYVIDFLALIAFSVIAFLLPFHHNAVFWLSYAFGAAAILAQIIAYPKAFDGPSARSKFYGFPIARLTTLYLGIQLVLSILFMALASLVPVWIPVILFVVLLCAAAAGFITTDAMREEVERQDTQRRKNVDTMRALQSKVNALAGMADEETGDAVKKLAEAFRYSDPVSNDALADIEADLNAQVDLLQQAMLENNNKAALNLIKKVTLTLTERNRLCKLNK
ncbi:MAG: hypothetical protein K6C08_12765 [Oscillospiraceae bacterium]|nr:hypothetical protein [Oscillospiraceae bacterium]